MDNFNDVKGDLIDDLKTIENIDKITTIVENQPKNPTKVHKMYRYTLPEVRKGAVRPEFSENTQNNSRISSDLNFSQIDVNVDEQRVSKHVDVITPEHKSLNVMKDMRYSSFKPGAYSSRNDFNNAQELQKNEDELCENNKVLSSNFQPVANSTYNDDSNHLFKNGSIITVDDSSNDGVKSIIIVQTNELLMEIPIPEAKKVTFSETKSTFTLTIHKTENTI